MMNTSRALLVLLAAIAFAPALRAQSLASASATDAERRATIEKSKRVITNADLPSVEAASASGATTDAAGDTTKSAPSSVDPKVVSVMAVIKNKCARDWPDDFKTSAYCQERQLEGLQKIAKRNGAGTMKTPDGRVIRSKCMREWEDDFKMANYCEEQQLKALGALGR